jgi:oxygen-independent coproporphyrinogen-3 oxidase
VRLTDDDCARRTVIQAIMCGSGVDYYEVESRHRLRFSEYFERELALLEPLAHDGLVVLSKDALEVTGTGRLLLRSVAMVFDAYIQAPIMKDAAPKFSRTV